MSSGFKITRIVILGFSILAASAEADVNGDGKADLIWQLADGQVWVWHLDGAQLLDHKQLAGATEWSLVAAADLDSDGEQDLIWQHPTHREVWVWFLNRGNFVRHARLSGATEWNVVGAADLDADGEDDLVWQHPQTGAVAAWYLRDGMYSGRDRAISGPTEWRAIGLGNVVGGFTKDLVWQHPSSGEVWAWELIQPGAVREHVKLSGPTEWRAVGLADLNGAGDDDLVWQHPTNGQVWGWYLWHSAERGPHMTGHVQLGRDTPAKLAAVSAKIHPWIRHFAPEAATLQQGAATTLRWSVLHSGDVQIEPHVGPVQPDGAITVRPSVTTTYQLRAARGPSTTIRYATVTVTEPPPPAGSVRVGIGFGAVTANAYFCTGSAPVRIIPGTLTGTTGSAQPETRTVVFSGLSSTSPPACRAGTTFSNLRAGTWYVTDGAVTCPVTVTPGGLAFKNIYHNVCQ